MGISITGWLSASVSTTLPNKNMFQAEARGTTCHACRMASACKLITSVDVEDKVADPGQVAVTVRHEAVLADGRRFLLLDDRGWGSSQLWSEASAREIEETTRVVVGPDTPPQGYTREKM
ncbi:hypothetical protein [Actinomadura formosensis]|uniref:hypothetical protein n=1 Tax=Actinomadura formosensis TaxID=60706 RepID=UPI001041AE37|nr:hypothetical protein [Actinomadura formosensis]